MILHAMLWEAGTRCNCELRILYSLALLQNCMQITRNNFELGTHGANDSGMQY